LVHWQIRRVISVKKSDVPNHLSAESKRLWNQLRADFAIDDAAGLLLLRNALEAHDRLTEARKILKREGVIVCDRFGHPKQHPASLVERDARQQLLAALRALRLEPGVIAQ
jgi:P27 family predicted phage terminase small subunit